MIKDKISVIIPVYNVEKYLRECIDSIINQTYENLEIIIIDDGSDDGSEVICDEYRKRDSRIIVMHKENGGLSSARNEGIKCATGEYIGFVDSDDVIHTEMFEVLYRNMTEQNANISCCSFEIFENILPTINHRDGRKIVYDRDEAIAHLLDDIGYKCFAWNKLFEKKMFDEVQFPNGKLYEDIVPAFETFFLAKKIVYTDRSLYYYRKRKNSISRSGFYYANSTIYDLRDSVDYALALCQGISNSLCNKIAGGYSSYYLHYLSVAYTENIDVSADTEKLKKYIKRNWRTILTAKNQYRFKKIQILLFYFTNRRLYSFMYKKTKH